MIDSRLGIRFHIAAAIIGLALTPIALLAQASPDYLPFDPARIGLPGLTETGRDSLIDQHKQLIEEARRAIEEIKRMDLSNAEEVIARYGEDILEEYRQIARLAAGRAQAAMKIAAAGQVSDLANLEAMVTTVLEASRYNKLSGNEEEAQRQYQGAVEVLTTFISNFQTTCYSQSFDPRIALGLERQNELLHMGLDVTPCSNRKYTAEAKGGDLLWRFSHCGWGMGEWKIEPGGILQGSGVATVEIDAEVAKVYHGANILSGTFSVDQVVSAHPTVRLHYSGDLKILPKPEEGSDSLGDLWVQVQRGTATAADGHVVVVALDDTVLIATVKKSDMPCRQGEE
jgi:hypothetical protein